MIEYTKGDILKSDVEALVNPVNCVGVMGAGLAAKFKESFPENFTAYQIECQYNQLAPGEVFPFRQATGGPVILNFPTKRHWRDLSKMEDIDAGLEDLRDLIDCAGIRSVAIPALGCGLGGLKWDDVRPRIEAALEGLQDVHVVIYEPVS